MDYSFNWFWNKAIIFIIKAFLYVFYFPTSFNSQVAFSEKSRSRGFLEKARKSEKSRDRDRKLCRDPRNPRNPGQIMPNPFNYFSVKKLLWKTFFLILKKTCICSTGTNPKICENSFSHLNHIFPWKLQLTVETSWKIIYLQPVGYKNDYNMKISRLLGWIIFVRLKISSMQFRINYIRFELFEFNI